MKISKIEFENFRNFKEKNTINFSTDGRVTVIYGTNGVGKTTLHQLFQWIFYGEVHFNKTASPKLYNLEREDELELNKTMSIKASVDFVHPDDKGEIIRYSLIRQEVYRKELKETKKINESLQLLKEVDNDWKPISKKANEIIETILPMGLSPYFFFDGESMIADLSLTGKDSAKSLRNALYSILDLDVYEHAIAHLGQQTNSTTVLGALYQGKANNCSNSDVIIARGAYNQAQNKVEGLEREIENCKASIDRIKKEINTLSEEIGGNPSTEVLQKRRTSLKKSIETLKKSIEREKSQFGNDVVDRYPYLLLSKTAEEAKNRLGLKIEEEKLLPGLEKDLVMSLLQEENCICGRCIDEKSRDSLRNLLKLFPPLSYKHIYEQFKNEVARMSANYDEKLLIRHIDEIAELNENISSFNIDIADIDKQQAQTKNVDKLVRKRAEEERSLEYWEKQLQSNLEELGIKKRIRDQNKKKLDVLLAASNENKTVDTWIEVMNQVKSILELTLNDSVVKYSRKLGSDIQELIDKMLTSKRRVRMTSKFELTVTDNYGNESKSEGQFAVVSFAYIGGIFKMIKSIPELRSKEYPLILDGPFSKLDKVQRQNVIDTIPQYAAQVILFSKDDLSDCFKDGNIDIWTIYSNEERNVSRVEKGYNAEVFSKNADYK